MEPANTEVVGLYLDFSAGPGIRNIRMCFVERTKEGTLICRSDERDSLRVILNHINAQELKSMMDMFDDRPWKIA